MSAQEDITSTDPTETLILWNEVSGRSTDIDNRMGPEHTLTILSRVYRIELRDDGLSDNDMEKTEVHWQKESPRDPSLLISMTDADCEALATQYRKLTTNNYTKATYSHWLSQVFGDLYKKYMTRAYQEHILKSSRVLSPPDTPLDDDDPPLSFDYRPDILFFYTDRALGHEAFKTWQKHYANMEALRATIALNVELEADQGGAKDAQAQALAAAALIFEQRLKIRQRANRCDFGDLFHYFCIFRASHFELYRMEQTAEGELGAWKLRVPNIDLSTSEGLRNFIKVWNNLMIELSGPMLESLKDDLARVGEPRQTKCNRLDQHRVIKRKAKVT
ncbi:MAG: hypothetical protein M1835_000130 [Candelina submexicana]|nr:MAG: hypothetical protein M1835_000130 [Candelina submexicana]